MDNKVFSSHSIINDKPSINEISKKKYTIDEAVEKMGYGRFQLKLAFLTGFAWMSDAMEMMILSILAPALVCEWLLTGWQKALITTISFLGMGLSGSIWGKLCDHYGRKKCLIICSIFSFYFGFLSSFSPIFLWLLILRGLVGFGVGGSPQAITLYAEFLPQSKRARCVIINNFSWSIGAVLEVLLAVIIMPTLGWRWLLGLSAIPLLMFVVFSGSLPESARFHMASGQSEQARLTLERISKENKVALPDGELENIENSQSNRGNISDLFKREYKKTTILLWFMWFANAFSYYGLVLVTTEIFQIGNTCKNNVGNDVSKLLDNCHLKCLTRDDYIDLLYTTLAEFPGLCITILIIDFIGRKRTLAFEFFMYSVFMYMVNLCVSRAFIAGNFQALYVYTPEYYPTVIRAIGLGTCSAMARVGAIITPFLAQVLLKTSPHLAISIYGSVGLMASVAALLLPFETKGRKLKD